MAQNDPLLVLNETFAKEIAYGVHSTLSNMFGIKPEMGAFRIEKNTALKADVSGIIVVMRDVADGTLVVSFPKETIFAMLSKMYRKNFSEIDHSVRMGVGELTNIIYGVMKSNLNKSGYSFKMAIPSVVIGEQHTVVHNTDEPTLVLPFETPLGGFHVCFVTQGYATAKVA